MELNFAFLPPFLLMVVGALLVTLTIIDLKFKKRNSYSHLEIAIGLYVAINGLVLAFIDGDLRLTYVQTTCLAFILYIPTVHLAYAAICDQIKINNENLKKKNMG